MKKITILIFLLFNIFVLTIKNCFSCNSINQGIFIYVSFSMPEQSLKKLIIDVAKKDIKAGLILRGLKDNNFLHTAAATYKLMLDKDNKTKQINSGIAIYPELFDEDNITVVPTFIWHRKNGKKIILKGDVSLDFFLDKAYNSLFLQENINKTTIDLGVWGNVYEIQEKNLIQVMKEKAKNYNWEKAINKAKTNLWQNTPTFNFPEAKKDRIYYIDLSFALDKDISLPDGKILYQKRKIINPLEYQILTSELLIFDYTKQKQINFVKNYLKKKKNKNNIILITSNFPKSSGIALLDNMTQTFNHQVYFLDQILVKKLKITELPLIAKQEKNFIKVNIIGIKEEKKK